MNLSLFTIASVFNEPCSAIVHKRARFRNSLHTILTLSSYNFQSKPEATLGRMGKATLRYLKNRSSLLRIAAGEFQWHPYRKDAGEKTPARAGWQYKYHVGGTQQKTEGGFGKLWKEKCFGHCRKPEVDIYCGVAPDI